MRKLLIANRGEVVVRVARSAAELAIATVAVHSADDTGASYLRAADTAAALSGSGPAAYLDPASIVAAAIGAGCDAVHPGWGFLSESAALSAACEAAGLVFVGASPALLELFGDKARARALAQACSVPVAEAAGTLADARRLLATSPVMVKAVAGGGGRGMRPVTDAAELDAAWQDCAAEARAAFGEGALYAERMVEPARHVEVQIAGDGDVVVCLGTRECSLQRRRQKLIEVAPAAQTEALEAAALTMARRVAYRGLGTWEFLVGDDGFVFMEVNPRLQVEHTVTEETTGLDLVAVQLRLAQGMTLAQLGVASPPAARGCAIELRINAESIDAAGDVRPASGTLDAFVPPTGPGVRVDHAADIGATPNPRFDTLLAKLIVRAPDRAAAFRRARRAAEEFRIDGLATNLAVLRGLLAMPDVQAGRVHTRFVDVHAAALSALQPVAAREIAPEGLAAGLAAARAPMVGLLVAVDVAPGDAVRRGQRVAMIEAMKMQMPVNAEMAGIVRSVAATAGTTLSEGEIVALIEPAAMADRKEAAASADPDAIRADLAEVVARHAAILDAARTEAVDRRHAQGKRTARENLDALFDPGSFIEYGALAVAAQRRRRSMEELIRLSPADGVIAGIGAVDGASCAALAYDYMAMAGTQGFMGHKKTDRLLHVTLDLRLPLVLLAEGGGGRPGETDVMGVAGLDLTTFARFAALSGTVPVVGIVAGNCFAGNAALLGCCDTIIATETASIGMGGPAMIEGGGLGVFTPAEVGPARMQAANGVVDLLVRDETQAVAEARRYLHYFRGRQPSPGCADQRLLRHAVPDDRKRAYDMRGLLAVLADQGSVMELRRGFAPGLLTALIRIDGHPFGVIANNPLHLGGAIDAIGADKAARFLQLCEAHGLPVLSLCDTPGFMVGPQTERTAQVRHVCRMFVAGAALTVPVFCVVTRKGYGLGAMSMAAGGFHETVFTAAWPSGEFGGMGLEGAIRLGYRRELAAEADPQARAALFETLVGRLYAEGKAINMASYLEIDAVIDPRDTRDWILRGLAAAGPRRSRRGGRFIDTW